MSLLHDRELWAAAVAGDAECFGVIFDRHAAAVHAYCRARAYDGAADQRGESAADAVSVVFLEAWRRRQDVVLEGDSALPWLLGIARRVLLRRARTMRRHRAALARLPAGTGLAPSTIEDPADEIARRLDDHAQPDGDPADRAGRVPDPGFVAFTRAQLPADQKHAVGLGQYANQPSVPGQSCDPGHPAAARPISGRAWSWYAGNGRTEKAHTVDLVVTGWAAGTGPANFQDIVDDTGYCRWMQPQHVRAGAIDGADASWLVTQTAPDGAHLGRVAVRVGDLIAAVSVEDLHSNAAALATARDLAAIAARNLARVHVPDRG